MDPADNRPAEQAIAFGFIVLTSLLVLGASYFASSDPMFKAMMKLSRESDLLAHRYVGEISPERVFADAWQGMQEAIPFKVELVSEPDTYPRQREQIDWGLTLTSEDKTVTVVAVAAHSPLIQILQPKDKILAIGDHNLDIFPNLNRYLNESPGDSVSIYFERNEVRESVKVSLTPPVATSVLAATRIDDVIYLSFNHVSEHLSDEISDSLSNLLQNSGKGIIIDLRRSRGGSREEVFRIAKLFLGLKPSLPIVLLVDASTERESENLAMQLLEREQTVAIGSPTRGLKTDAEEIRLWSGEKLYVSSGDPKIDFNLGENSQASQASDSIKADTAAASGRIVPDLKCEELELPGLVFDLLHRGYMLDFVAASSYRQLPAHETEPQLYDDFLALLQTKNYRYDPTGDALHELESHTLTPEMRRAVGDMRSTQESITSVNFEDYRGDITRQLLVLIQRVKVGGQPAVADKLRLDDYCLQTAFAYLEGKRPSQ